MSRLAPVYLSVYFLLLLLVSSLPSNMALADVTNRNLLPIGEREALLANTGITSATSGAAFYNPANLTHIAHPSVSMTGTTIMRFDVSTDSFLVIDGVAQPFEASGLLTIPASLASTYPLGDWTVATAVLVPNAFEVSNQTTFELGDGLGITILQNQRAQELWLGAAVGRALGKRLSIGVSAYAVRQTSSSIVLIQLSDEVLGASQTTSSLETNALGITAIAGLAWRPSARLKVGLRVQTPLARISGTANLYEASIDSIDPSFEEVSESRDDFATAMPWDLGAGVSVRVSKAVELMADVNVQLPQTIREFSGRAASEKTLETAVRASVATQVAITKNYVALFGLLYNGSAEPTPQEGGESRENYYGVTGGLTRQSGRTRTGIGAFFHQSRGELIPLGGEQSAKLRSRAIGGLLTVSYSL